MEEAEDAEEVRLDEQEHDPGHEERRVPHGLPREAEGRVTGGALVSAPRSSAGGVTRMSTSSRREKSTVGVASTS